MLVQQTATTTNRLTTKEFCYDICETIANAKMTWEAHITTGKYWFAHEILVNDKLRACGTYINVASHTKYSSVHAPAQYCELLGSLKPGDSVSLRMYPLDEKGFAVSLAECQQQLCVRMVQFASAEQVAAPPTAPAAGWKIVGQLKDLQQVLNEYPLTHYVFGLAYNSPAPLEVEITNWNRGRRVFIKNLIPHGDNASTFHSGRAMFTNETDDTESKGCYYHRYVTPDFKPCCGTNGKCDTLPLYAKAL